MVSDYILMAVQIKVKDKTIQKRARKRMKDVAIHNLGCKVNSYETEVMQQMLQEKGYHIVPFDERADIYIVNTCTVTNIADRKSRQMLHRAKQLNPDAVVVAVGCYVQTGQETLERDHSVDLAVGNNRKKDIVSILEEFLRERKSGENRGGSDKTLRGTTVPDISHTDEYEEMTLRRTAEHTRAYIKIQDGCNQFCSYCAIPYARGRVRSRREEDILEEIRGLAAEGYKEIVLTGIHISSYGIDFDGKKAYSGESRLAGLVEKIHGLEGLERIRLGSLEPRFVTEDTARRLSALPKVCPHFHLSLQSGCDAVLKRMNRHYTTGEYYTSVEVLRRFFDEPAVTTDIIVGFPGETEEEFAETAAFLEKVRFYEMHVFKYSRRAGTAAAEMRDQVPERIKAQRSGHLTAMEKRQSMEFRRRYIGRDAVVLLEEKKDIAGVTYLVGHTGDYVKAAVKEAPGLEPNQTVKIPIKGFLTEEILV